MRDSVRAGSASYVSRRHFSTICQSPPFFFSPLSSFYRALICIVSRREQTAFVVSTVCRRAGKNGKSPENANAHLYLPLALSSPSECESHATLVVSFRCENVKARTSETSKSECNISADDVYFIKETRISTALRLYVPMKFFPLNKCMTYNNNNVLNERHNNHL